MDRNLKNSLLFGAAVGGVFSLLRRSGEKHKLTDNQLKSLDDLKEIFTKVENFLSENLSLSPIYTSVKELEPQKQYEKIINLLEKEIQEDAENLGIVKSFKSRLQYVLSGRFTEEKNNARAHESQVFFSPLKELPNILECFLEKRTQILRLMQKAFRYIEAGEATDFKPVDKQFLQSYMSQLHALEKQAAAILSEFN